LSEVLHHKLDADVVAQDLEAVDSLIYRVFAFDRKADHMEDLADDRVSEDVIDCHLMLEQKLRGLDKANQRALRDYAVFRLTVFSAVHAIEALEETHNEV